MDAERTGKRGPHQADTPPRVGNYVTARVGNYVTDNPSNLGKYVTADIPDVAGFPDLAVLRRLRPIPMLLVGIDTYPPHPWPGCG